MRNDNIVGDWLYLRSHTDGETTLTGNVNEALTTHLRYSAGTDTLFNYTRNDDWYKANGVSTEGVTRRLYTSVGWSHYLLYQDYDWGVTQIGAGVNYDDLVSQEISTCSPAPPTSR